MVELNDKSQVDILLVSDPTRWRSRREWIYVALCKVKRKEDGGGRIEVERAGAKDK